jgi:hypothetical protein
MAEAGHLSVRMAYSLFAQKPGEEMADYTRWLGMTKPGKGDAICNWIQKCSWSCLPVCISCQCTMGAFTPSG